MKLRYFSALCAIALVSLTSQAELLPSPSSTTINFNEFPVDPTTSTLVLDNQYANLGVQFFGGVVLGSSVGPASPFGNQVAYSNTFDLGNLGEGFVKAVFTFDAAQGPVTLVSSLVFAESMSGDNRVTMTAFDADNHIVDKKTVDSDFSTFTPISVSSSLSNPITMVTVSSPTLGQASDQSLVELANLTFGRAAPTLDLSLVAPLSISQNGATTDGGVLQLTAGVPVQVNVTATGLGFDSPESRSATLQIKAGSFTDSKTISLSELQAAGSLSIQFTPTFGPHDLGNQTIVVTVNQGQLEEIDFGNNSVATQVNVLPSPSYQLAVYVDGKPAPASGGRITLPPSVLSCKSGATTFSQSVPLQVVCVDPNNGNKQVNGCGFTLHLAPGENDGGHTHNLNGDGPAHPLILDANTDLFVTDQALSVDDDGDDLVYTPPEVSGDIILSVSGTDPSQKSIPGASFVFQIQSPLVFQKIAVPGLTIVTASHPGTGDYGTAEMQSAVGKMVSTYYSAAQKRGIAHPHTLGSQAASLASGGVFDANWNGSMYGPSNPFTPWKSPHCGHRDGETLDLSLSPFIGENGELEKSILEQAARNAGLNFVVPGERPEDIESNHWHATLRHTRN